LRIKIKILIRPIGIAELTSKDFKKLTFFIEGEKSIAIKNPTPWNIAIPGVKIGEDIFHSINIKPFSEEKIDFKSSISAGAQITYEVINDLGAIESFSTQARIRN